MTLLYESSTSEASATRWCAKTYWRSIKLIICRLELVEHGGVDFACAVRLDFCLIGSAFGGDGARTAGFAREGFALGGEVYFACPVARYCAALACEDDFSFACAIRIERKSIGIYVERVVACSVGIDCGLSWVPEIVQIRRVAIRYSY